MGPLLLCCLAALPQPSVSQPVKTRMCVGEMGCRLSCMLRLLLRGCAGEPAAPAFPPGHFSADLVRTILNFDTQQRATAEQILQVCAHTLGPPKLWSRPKHVWVGLCPAAAATASAAIPAGF